mgnify:CR=1 FL=1
MTDTKYEDILKLVGVSKAFSGNLVLNEVNLSLPAGAIVGLLGPNGSGKTTILKLENGLLTPTSGTVLVNGMPPGVESKKIISYLPERTYLNNWMRISELLDFFADFYEDFDRKKAEEMLKSLDVDQTAVLKTLSKGTKEKVQLVLVMSRKARLYLLDEPIGGVDPAARDYILQTILNNYMEDATILLSTHLIQDVEHIFDRIIFLNKGRVVLEGAADTIREEKGKSIDALFREEFRC